MASQDTPPTQRAQLRDLVRARREELHLSLASLAQRCVDPASGVTVKQGWIHRLESGEPVKAPDLDMLRALSVGLVLPLESLQDAAGSQFFGIDTMWSSSGDARAFVDRVERLTPAQRRQLLLFLDTFPDSRNQ